MARGLHQILLREIFRTQKVFVVIGEHEFLAVEQNEIDAVPRLQPRHVVRQFLQHGYAAGPVVRADEIAFGSFAVAVGVGARVVMSAEHDSLFPLRVPFDDQIRERDFRAVLRVPDVERLQADLPAELREMVVQHFLLPQHSARTAGPRADLADFFQVAVAAFAVNRDIAQRQRGGSSAGVTVVVKQREIHDGRDRADNDRTEEKRRAVWFAHLEKTFAEISIDPQHDPPRHVAASFQF